MRNKEVCNWFATLEIYGRTISFLLQKKKIGEIEIEVQEQFLPHQYVHHKSRQQSRNDLNHKANSICAMTRRYLVPINNSQDILT